MGTEPECEANNIMDALRSQPRCGSPYRPLACPPLYLIEGRAIDDIAPRTAWKSVGKASSGRAASQAFGGCHECVKSQGCPRLSRGSVCRNVSRIGRDFRLRTG
jgi:hypothetical protein